MEELPSTTLQMPNRGPFACHVQAERRRSEPNRIVRSGGRHRRVEMRLRRGKGFGGEALVASMPWDAHLVAASSLLPAGSGRWPLHVWEL